MFYSEANKGMSEIEPPPLTPDETARLLAAMRAALPAEEVDFFLSLAKEGPTPFGAPDNVRFLYAQHGQSAQLPAWFAAKYSAFLS